MADVLERVSGIIRRAIPGLAGAGASTVAGPIGGAAATAALETALETVNHDFFTAQLSAAQERRSRACFEETLKRIWNRRARGEGPSSWVLAKGGPAKSTEILEAGLWHAREQFEERKIKHLAALMEYVFYAPALGPSDAHHLLQLAARLSYRQLVLLALFAEEGSRAQLPDKTWGWSLIWTDMGLLMEADALARLHMLATVKDFRLLTNYSEINPRHTRASLEGDRLYQGMALAQLDRGDKTELIRQIGFVGSIVAGDRPVF